MKTPQERVEAYIGDWHQAWKDCGGNDYSRSTATADGLTSLFGKWHSAVDTLAKKHWATGCHDESGSSFGTPPTHDPLKEQIRRANVVGDSATVETQVLNFSTPTYYEYRLKMERDSWRIASVLELYDDEDDPAFSADALKSLLGRASATATLPLPDKGDEPNCEVLFDEGHLIKGTLMQEPEAIKVRRVGKIFLPSGTIVARDFGYSSEDARPLSLRVPPGEYGVEICLLDRSIAAIRIVFEAPSAGPFSYRKAVTVDSDDSVIGVDAGNVALCDAKAFMERSKREHTRDQELWRTDYLTRAGKERDVSFLKLSGSAVATAVVSESGHGDGGYPAFWVFDSQNRLTALVVDFLIAAEFLNRSVRLPWKPGISGTLYQEPDLTISVDQAKGVTILGESINEIRWLDSTGKAFVSSHEFGLSSSGNEQTYQADLKKLDEKAAEIEVLIHTGFRNNR